MKTSKAFTAIEIVLTILIIGILAVIVIRRIQTTIENAKYHACFANVRNINAQIELYMALTGEPMLMVSPGLVKETSVASSDYFPEGVPICPVTERDYYIGGTSGRVEGHNSYTIESHSLTRPINDRLHPVP